MKNKFSLMILASTVAVLFLMYQENPEMMIESQSLMAAVLIAGLIAFGVSSGLSMTPKVFTDKIADYTVSFARTLFAPQYQKNMVVRARNRRRK